MNRAFERSWPERLRRRAKDSASAGSKQTIASANIVISGSSTVLVRDGAELIDVLRKGQGVLNVLALSGVKDEVDARIVELFPTPSADDSAFLHNGGRLYGRWASSPARTTLPWNPSLRRQSAALSPA